MSKIPIQRDMLLVRALVERILDKPLAYRWTVRGSGRVLRLDLTEQVCLHIWRPSMAVQGVSVIHDHTWDLRSVVVCGSLVNRVYEEVGGFAGSFSMVAPALAVPPVSNDVNIGMFVQQGIVCGEGGGLTGDSHTVYLAVREETLVSPGESYEDKHTDIHETLPMEGTITLVERTVITDRNPRVFWRSGEARRDIPPRQASSQEILGFISIALPLLQASRPEVQGDC